jgi:hypothetical protein
MQDFHIQGLLASDLQQLKSLKPLAVNRHLT